MATNPWLSDSRKRYFLLLPNGEKLPIGGFSIIANMDGDTIAPDYEPGTSLYQERVIPKPPDPMNASFYRGTIQWQKVPFLSSDELAQLQSGIYNNLAARETLQEGKSLTEDERKMLQDWNEIALDRNTLPSERRKLQEMTDKYLAYLRKQGKYIPANLFERKQVFPPQDNSLASRVSKSLATPKSMPITMGNFGNEINLDAALEDTLATKERWCELMVTQYASQMEKDFQEIRKVSTPWCAVRTPDWFNCIQTLSKVRVNNDEEMPPIVWWRCTHGPSSPLRDSTGKPISKLVQLTREVTMPDGSRVKEPLGPGDTPADVLLAALESLPAGGMLFMVIPDASFFQNAYTIQAISNVREVFKLGRRTLILVSREIDLPPFLSDDIPVLDEPLPTKEELEFIISKTYQDTKLFKQEQWEKEAPKAADVCLGMTLFSAEECIVRKLKKTGMDFKGLGELQRQKIEDSSKQALRFQRETWTYSQMGGAKAFKGFMTDIMKGPNEPSLIVWMDEIDKDVNASSTGTVADNTGASQYILKSLLSNMENRKAMGLLAVGCPGSGKSLACICTGNEFGKRTLALDLGSVKGSLLGESEANMRRVMDIIFTIGGDKVLFIATANRLDTMPPELQARFWLGTWIWDLPTQEERKIIWEIQLGNFQVDPKQKKPKDTGWVGRDIRNCVKMAWICGCSLIEASQRITIASRNSLKEIETLRDMAELKGYLSANEPGPYKRPANGKREVEMSN